jgi:hypothetical protein
MNSYVFMQEVKPATRLTLLKLRWGANRLMPSLCTFVTSGANFGVWSDERNLIENACQQYCL